MRPDLDDPRTRAAYRRELRELGLGWRLTGMALGFAGMAGIGWNALTYGGEGMLYYASWAALVAGLLLMFGVNVYRRRHHRRRTGGD